ncbi:GNAT family N-acetyltransferase [Streptomyces chumphonensis]|uniref:GNAT family N-acetyltransferase n=1 Tax=Streptomyces chumphonensis TaxID=1214925 RepID=A0A927F2G4_9ACTN|nr:GNAT family N-acetyltransferase [Streptomyces chumphonensis]MBD3933096.1 GNAT family N-acetyltransferase [Streptomyces chumphonensis]
MPLPCPELLPGEGFNLRRHRPADREAFAAFLTDPEATRHMAFTAEQKTPQGAQDMLDYVISAYGSDHEVLSLTIADAADDSYLGSIGGTATDTDGVVEIYYTVIPGEQGRGLATGAVQLLLAYLFALPGVTSVRADVTTDNQPSLRVLEKLGFQDRGPVERDAGEGELAHVSLTGRRYVRDADAYEA